MPKITQRLAEEPQIKSRGSSGKEGEQALVAAQKGPQSLQQVEDELAMKKGKVQLLIEVLVEQKGLLLFTRRGEEAALDVERSGRN
jgi:hypothetical protein